LRAGQITFILNTLHAFYRHIYAPLLTEGQREFIEQRKRLELVLLALARTQHLDWDENERLVLNRFMTEWSRAISVFIKEE
jgi:hypothetical protein